MAIGLVVTAPAVAIEGVPPRLDRHDVILLAVAGPGSVLGLVLAYTALRIGKVGVVAPVVSTQGRDRRRAR